MELTKEQLLNLMNKQTSVSFIYDDTLGKWEVVVAGVLSELEARQAFNAVIITVQMATPTLEANKAEQFGDEFYKISIGHLI